MIILPAKQMDLQKCTLSVAALILTIIGRTRQMKYERLLDLVVRGLGEDAKIQYHNALSLLFILGSIVYDDSDDSIVSVTATHQGAVK